MYIPMHEVLGVSASRELEKQACLSCLMWVLGKELGSSSRAVCSQPLSHLSDPHTGRLYKREVGGLRDRR